MCPSKKFPTDAEIRERVRNAGKFWGDDGTLRADKGFDRVDIYFFVAPYPGTSDEREMPLLLSSLGEPYNSRINEEVREFGGHEFRTPFDININLHRVWMGTREKYKDEMGFLDDKKRFEKEVVMSADELKNEGFKGDCDDFAREDLSKAQMVLKYFADYLGMPADNTLWAARYVIGETHNGIGHASLNLADLKKVIKKGKPKCKWRNPNSTTFYREANRRGWRSFRRFPKVGSKRFGLNHRNIWGSADDKQCYMRVADLPNVGDEFYDRYNLVFYFTQQEKKRFGEDGVNGMKGLLTAHHYNVEAMKTALNLAEEYAKFHGKLDSTAISYISGELGNQKIGRLTMLQRIGEADGVIETLRLKYQF